jgi:hypothetical protein
MVGSSVHVDTVPVGKSLQPLGGPQAEDLHIPGAAPRSWCAQLIYCSWSTHLCARAGASAACCIGL